jgi:transposase
MTGTAGGPMHVRENKVRKKGRIYRYVQLVESYRRDDGMPATRIVASFGDLSETSTASLRTFVQALSTDQPLRMDGEATPRQAALRVLANLDYLHLAVLLEVWEQSGLAAWLRRNVRDQDACDVPIADVIAALILHRCVAADSKLAAERWFPTTALPELFGWAPEKFNNSRLHRALEVLETVDQDLQRELPGVLRNTYGAFTAIFVDGTDTWFEGYGPDMASKGRVKDGTYRRKILIVVACDARGFPLRWATFDGSKSEVHALQEMAVTIGSCPWIQDAPLIADRALGNAVSIEVLANTGRRFLVAVPEHEIPHWVPTFDGLDTDLDAGAAAAAQAAVVRMGFERVNDQTYVLDGASLTQPEVPAPDDEEVEEVENTQLSEEPASRLAAYLTLARGMRAAGGSFASIGAQFGLSKTQARKTMQLLALPEDVQVRIEAGVGADVPLLTIGRIVAEHPDDATRREAFDALLSLEGRTKRHVSGLPSSMSPAKPSRQRSVGRPVLYFNPVMWSDQRRRAAERLVQTEEAIADLNHRLARRPVAADTARVRADRLLRSSEMAGLFTVDVGTNAAGKPAIVATLDRNAWKRRRRFDGCSLLVAHPAMTQTGPELVERYRQRDVIEADFRTLKSVVELRPVHHRTDAKVRAHVSLCVMATLLHRLLEHHLATAGSELSANRALATLALCHLNRIATAGATVHTTTAIHDEARELLTRLDLTHLSDDDHVTSRIVAR